MSNVRQWTPLQEGRFHLRNKKPTERWTSYITRIYDAEMTAHARRRLLKRIQSNVQLARKETNRLLQQRLRRQMKTTSGVA